MSIHTVTHDLNLSKLLEDIPLEVEFSVDIDEPTADDEGCMVIEELWWTIRSRRVDDILVDIRKRINAEIARLIDDGVELAELARGQSCDAQGVKPKLKPGG